MSLLPSDCRLVSSQCNGELDTWFLSPAFPCRGRDKRIGDIVMHYLLDEVHPLPDSAFCFEFYDKLRSVLLKFRADTNLYARAAVINTIASYLFNDFIFYSENDVIVFTPTFLGSGASKVVNEASEFFSGRSCAALVERYPGGKLKPEFDATCQWNNTQGLVGAYAYYRDNTGLEMMLAPKFDLSFDDYLYEVEASGRPMPGQSFIRITLDILQGLKTLEEHNLYHSDLGRRNVVVRCCGTAVSEAAVCDLENLSNEKRVLNESLTAAAVMLSLVANAAKVKDWPTYESLRSIPTVAKLLKVAQDYFYFT